MASNYVAVAPNQGCLCLVHIPAEIWTFFFLTPWFTVHEKEEENNSFPVFFLPLS